MEKAIKYKNVSAEKYRNKIAYTYIAPFYVLFLIFSIFPIFSGFIVSFFDWDGVTPMFFVGFSNYIQALSDPIFIKSMYNTAFIGIISTFLMLFIAIILAYILSSKLIAFKSVFKTIYFLPMVTSVVATSIVFQTMFGYNYGLINIFFDFFGFEKINWFGDKGQYIKFAIIILFVWRWTGWNMLMYLAGMQGINTDLYEAATIDGANHIIIFFRITLPLLKPIILFTIISSIIGSTMLFTEPFMLLGSLQGGISNEGLTSMMYLMSKAPLGGNHFGYASAVGYVLVVIIVLISVIVRKVFEEKPYR